MEKDTIEEGSLAWRMLHEYDEYEPILSEEERKEFWDSIPRIPDDEVEDWQRIKGDQMTVRLVEGDRVLLKDGIHGSIFEVFNDNSFGVDDAINDVILYDVKRNDILKKIFDYDTQQQVNIFVN